MSFEVYLFVCLLSWIIIKIMMVQKDEKYLGKKQFQEVCICALVLCNIGYNIIGKHQYIVTMLLQVPINVFLIVIAYETFIFAQ